MLKKNEKLETRIVDFIPNQQTGYAFHSALSGDRIHDFLF